MAHSSPAALGDTRSSTRHRDNVTARVCLQSVTTGVGVCVHRAQTELLLARAVLCVHPEISRHLKKVGGSEENSQANAPFSLLVVMGWICSSGQPLPLVSCFMSVRSRASF